MTDVYQNVYQKVYQNLVFYTLCIPEISPNEV